MRKQVIFTAFSLLLTASLPAAELALQDSSVVSFLHIEEDDTSKTYAFNTVSGSIKDNQTTITVKADSLDAMARLQNTPLKAHLLKAQEHAEIKVSADTAEVIAKLETDQEAQVTIPATLSLLGIEKEIMLRASLLKSKDDGILVSSIKPILIYAKDYGITDGVRKLSKLTSGIDIPSAVPVSFKLHFK